MKHSITIIGMAAAMLLSVGAATADDSAVYGWQLMTKQERVQYREKMRSLKTRKEREAFRREHHAQMQERARERGVKLPDQPRPRGNGMGQGQGQGGGMGPGGGRY
jgi:hypothetical protein